MYLLDTNALLYFLYDSEKLSKRASDIIYRNDENHRMSVPKKQFPGIVNPSRLCYHLREKPRRFQSSESSRETTKGQRNL